jgi:uncharacterized membrane protein
MFGYFFPFSEIPAERVLSRIYSWVMYSTVIFVPCFVYRSAEIPINNFRQQPSIVRGTGSSTYILVYTELEIIFIMCMYKKI